MTVASNGNDPEQAKAHQAMNDAQTMSTREAKRQARQLAAEILTRALPQLDELGVLDDVAAEDAALIRREFVAVARWVKP